MNKSTDGGASWTPHNRGFVATSIFRVPIAASDSNRLYADTWKSSDAGESWSILGSGFTEASVRAVDPRQADTVYGGGPDGLKKSTDGGDSWRTIFSGTADRVAIDPQDPDTLYTFISTGIFSADLYRSVDGGEQWTRIAVLPVRAYVLAVDPHDRQVLYAGGFRGIYRSRDGGLTWPVSGLRTTVVDSVTVATDRPGRVYVTATDGIYRSEDGGESWQRLSSLSMLSLVIDPADGERLYVGGERGLYKSTDGGQSWTASDRGLTVRQIYHVAMAPDTGRLYAATGGAGVWYSDDQGETWE